MKLRSKRFCINCKKVTRFFFKESEGHSRCEFCNGYKAIEPLLKRKIKLYLNRNVSK